MKDAALFDGTIMENIRYGRLDATDEEIIAAGKRQLITIARSASYAQLYAASANLGLRTRPFLSTPPSPPLFPENNSGGAWHVNDLTTVAPTAFAPIESGLQLRDLVAQHRGFFL